LYALPIGFYLDTSDERIIKSANRFWKNALAEEGFTIIAEREVRGSFFKVIFARARNKEDRKRQLLRLKKNAIEFTKKFENVAQVVILGTSLIGPAPHQPQPPPAVPYVMSLPQAHKAWQEVIQKFKDRAHSAEETAGGLLAAYDLAKKKQKKKRGDADDDRGGRGPS
jgi:hypothetical protein